MNVDELQSVRNRERQTDSLQQLSDSFYRDAGDFIRDLKRERSRVAGEADDPFDSTDVRRLTDEIKTAESTVESIYERRVGKIVKEASLEAAGMPADADGLTAEELELFEQLVAAIENNREHVLEGLLADGTTLDCTDTTGQAEPADDALPDSAGETPSGSPEAPDSSETGVSAADAMGGSEPAAGDDRSRVPPDSGPAGADAPDPAGAPEPESDPEPAASYPAPGGDEDGDIERATVRITDDVGEIYGIDDRSYELSQEDVVTLPTVNAGPLLEQGAAERLD